MGAGRVHRIRRLREVADLREFVDENSVLGHRGAQRADPRVLRLHLNEDVLAPAADAVEVRPTLTPLRESIKLGCESSKSKARIGMDRHRGRARRATVL